MQTLNVLLLCSNTFRVRRFSRLLGNAAFVRLQVVCSHRDWARFPPCAQSPDLVICDSLPSSAAIHYLRRLCEHYGVFSMIESEALEASVRWGLANFRGHSGKHCLGSFDELDAPRFGEMLLKALAFKSRMAGQDRQPRRPDRQVSQADALQALEQRQIVPFFQPQVCLKTRRITGAEALVRWLHPSRGVLGPAAFLGLFNHPDHHRQLFHSLLQQGLELQRQLQARKGPELVFSYNVEASQLCDPEFARQVLHRIDAAAVPAGQVTLEITEREALALDMPSIENISVLVNSGVRLSLDDFGSGHSSITRLAQMPFSQVKLDAGLIGNALGTKQSRIIEAVARLARSLELELVAEGVETPVQRAHLQRLGVVAAQGYLFYKPMEGANLLRLLATQDPAPRTIRQEPGVRGSRGLKAP